MYSQNQGDSRATAPPTARESIGDAHLPSMPGDHVPVWADARPHQSYTRDGRTDRDRERITGKRDWTERGSFPRTVIPGAGINGAAGSSSKRRPPGRHGFFGENGRYGGGNILRGGDAGQVFGQGLPSENGNGQWKFERDGFFAGRPPLNPGFNGGTGVDERRVQFSREGYAHGVGEGRDGNTVLEAPGRPFHSQGGYLEADSLWDRERAGRGKDVSGATGVWDRENRGGERAHGKGDGYRRGTVGPFGLSGGFSQLHDVGRDWGNEKELEGRVDRYGRDGSREGWSGDGMGSVGRDTQVLLPSTSADWSRRERGGGSRDRNGFLGSSGAANGCNKESVKSPAPLPGDAAVPLAPPSQALPSIHQQHSPTSPSIAGPSGNASIADAVLSQGQSPPPKRARLGWGQGLAQFEKKKVPSGKDDACDDNQGPFNLAPSALGVEDTGVTPSSPSWEPPQPPLDASPVVDLPSHLPEHPQELVDGCDNDRDFQGTGSPCQELVLPCPSETALLGVECSETTIAPSGALDVISVVGVPSCEEASATATPEVAEPARVVSYDGEKACMDPSDLQNEAEALAESELREGINREGPVADEEIVAPCDEGLGLEEKPAALPDDAQAGISVCEEQMEEAVDEVVVPEVGSLDNFVPGGPDSFAAADGMPKVILSSEEAMGGERGGVEEEVFVEPVTVEEVVAEVATTFELPDVCHADVVVQDEERRGEESRSWTKFEILTQMEKVDLEIEQLERKLSTLGAEVEVAEGALELRDSPSMDPLQPVEETALGLNGENQRESEAYTDAGSGLQGPSLQEAVSAPPSPCGKLEQDGKDVVGIVENKIMKEGNNMEGGSFLSGDVMMQDKETVVEGMQQVEESFAVVLTEESVEKVLEGEGRAEAVEERLGDGLVGLCSGPDRLVEEACTSEPFHSVVADVDPVAIVKKEPNGLLVCEGDPSPGCKVDTPVGLEDVKAGEPEAEKVALLVVVKDEAGVEEDEKDCDVLLVEGSDLGPAQMREAVDLSEVAKRWHWMDAVIEENKEKAHLARTELQHLVPHVSLSSSDRLYTSPQEAPVWWENVIVHLALEERMREALCQRDSELKLKEQLLALKYRAVREIWRHEQLQGGGRRDRFFKDKLPFRKAEVERPAAQRSSGRLRLTMLGGKGTPGTPGEDAMIVPEDLPSLRRLMSEACTQPILPVREELKMPEMILDSRERGHARFIDRNSLVEDPVELEIQRQAANPWTPEERKIFLDKFAAFNKNFTKIASFLEHKTTSDCVEFYYRNQKGEDFERIRKRQQLKKRRDYTRGASYLVNTTTASSRREAARIEQLAVAAAKEAAEKQAAAMAAAKAARHAVNLSRAESGVPSGEFVGEDSGLAQSSGGSPDMDSSVVVLGRGMRRHAVSEPAAGMEVEAGGRAEQGVEEISERRSGERTRREGLPRGVDDREVQWTAAEETVFVESLSQYGKDFKAIALSVASKTQAQCRAFFSRSRKRLGLDHVVSQSCVSHGTLTPNERGLAAPCENSEPEDAEVQVVEAGWQTELGVAAADGGKDEELPSSLVLGDVTAVEEGHGSCHGRGPGLSGWLEPPALQLPRMEDGRGLLGEVARRNVTVGVGRSGDGIRPCGRIEEREGGIEGGGVARELPMRVPLDTRVGSPGAAGVSLVGLAGSPSSGGTRAGPLLEGPVLDLQVGCVDGALHHHVRDVSDSAPPGSMRSCGEPALLQSLARIKDESDGGGVVAGLSLATGGSNRATLAAEAEVEARGEDAEGSLRGALGRATVEQARDVIGREELPETALGLPGSWREFAMAAANTSAGGPPLFNPMPVMRVSNPLTDFMLGTGQVLSERGGMGVNAPRGAVVLLDGPNGRPLSRGGLVKDGSIPVPGSEPKQRREPTSWTQEEKEKFAEIIRSHGKDWTLLQDNIPGKSLTQIKTYFQNSKAKLGFSALVDIGQGGATSGSVARSGGGNRKRKAEELEISSRSVTTSGGGAPQGSLAGPAAHQNGGSGPALADDGVSKMLPPTVGGGGGLVMGMNPPGAGSAFGLLPGRGTGSAAGLGSVGELSPEQQQLLMQQLMQSFMKSNGGYPPVGHGHPGYMFPMNMFPPAAFAGAMGASAMGLRSMQQQQTPHPMMATAPLMPMPLAPFRRPADLGVGQMENGEGRGGPSKEMLSHGGSGRSSEGSGHLHVPPAPVPQPRSGPPSDVKLFGQSLLSQPVNAPSRSASPAIPDERVSSQGGASQPASSSQAAYGQGGSQQSLATGSNGPLGFGRDMGLAPPLYRQGTYGMLDPRHAAGMWPGLASTSAPVAARQSMSWDVAGSAAMATRSAGVLERENGSGQEGKRGPWDPQDQDESHHGSGSTSSQKHGQASRGAGGGEGYGSMHGEDSGNGSYDWEGGRRGGLESQHGEAGGVGLMTSLLGRGKSDHMSSKQAGLSGRGAEQGGPVTSRSMDAGGGVGSLGRSLEPAQNARGRVPGEHGMMMAAALQGGSQGMMDISQHEMIDWGYGCMPDGLPQWGLRREGGGEGARDGGAKQAAFDLLGGLGGSLGGGVYGEAQHAGCGESMHHPPNSPLPHMMAAQGQGYGGWLDPRLQHFRMVEARRAERQAMHQQRSMQQQQRGGGGPEEYMKAAEPRENESRGGGGGGS